MKWTLDLRYLRTEERGTVTNLNNLQLFYVQESRVIKWMWRPMIYFEFTSSRCLFQSRKATRRKRRITVGREPTDRRKLSPSIRDRVTTGPSRSPSRFNDHYTDANHRHHPYRSTEFGASVRSVAPDADRKQRSEKLLRVIHGDSCQRTLWLSTK